MTIIEDKPAETRGPVDRYARGTHNATWIIAGAGVCTLLAAIVQAFIFGGQLSAMKSSDETIRGQLAEMKSQRLLTMSQLKANLRREKPSTIPIGKDGELIGVGQQLFGWNLSPWWTNVGGTDAKNVKFWWDIKMMPFREGDALPVCPKIDQSAETTQTILSPQGTLIASSRPILIADVTKAMKGNLSQLIYVLGRIEYNDVFLGTQTHFLDWCVNLAPNDLSNNVFSFIRIRDETD